MKIWSIKWPGSSIWTCWRTSAWWSIWEVEYSPWTVQVCSWRYLRCMRSSNPPHTDSVHFPPRGSCRLGELWNYSAVWGETFLAFLWQDPARQATNLHQISHPRGLMTRQQCNDTNDKVDIRQSVSQGLQQRPAWTMSWSDFVNNLVMTQLSMLRNISKYKVVNLPVYFYCWSKWPLMSDLCSPDCFPVQGRVSWRSVHQLCDRVGIVAPPVHGNLLVVVHGRDGDRSLCRPEIRHNVIQVSVS